MYYVNTVANQKAMFADGYHWSNGGKNPRWQGAELLSIDEHSKSMKWANMCGHAGFQTVYVRVTPKPHFVYKTGLGWHEFSSRQHLKDFIAMMDGDKSVKVSYPRRNSSLKWFQRRANHA